MVKASCPVDLPLGILLSAVIRSFSVISLSRMSKLLELRFGKAMLFKNDSLSESDLEAFFLKRFLLNLHMQPLISSRSVMSLPSSIKCLSVVFIAFVFQDSKRTLSVFLPVDTIHICYGFLNLRPFYHKYFRALAYTSYKR